MFDKDIVLNQLEFQLFRFLEKKKKKIVFLHSDQIYKMIEMKQ